MHKKHRIDDIPFFRISNWYLYIKGWKIRVGIILFLLLIAIFIYVAGKKTIENYQLANRGKLSKGVFLSRKKVGGKGTIYVEYEFRADSIGYMGSTNNEEYEKGDSIFVIYMEERPEINRSYTFIKNNYTTPIAP